MQDKFERQRIAISVALDFCTKYNIDWHKHLKLVIDNKEVIGYCVKYKKLEFTVMI